MKWLWRVVNWFVGTNKPPVVRRTYPRADCPLCGRQMAVTSHGAWRHKCQALLPLDGGDAR